MRSLALRAMLLCLLCAVGCAIVWSSLATTQAAANPQAQEAQTRKSYADATRKTYSFRFGEKISLPGSASIEGNDFIEPSAFLTASYCGHCHQESHKEWRQSLHSNSFRTPFYQTSVQIVMRTKGVEFARHCDSCHNPIGVLAGGLTPASTVDRRFDKDGVTCTVCHSIQKVDSKLGNGSFTLAVPAALVDEQGKRIPGMVPDSEILAHLDRHSKAVMQPIYQSPELCSACHKANFPPILNDYKWIRAFSSYDEWQNSKFSQQNPLTFYTADYTTCQGCHMKREPLGLPDPGAKQGLLASHRWPAGNTAVPFYYGFDDQLKKTIDFLKSGSFLNVDIFAIKLGDSDELIAPLGSVAFNFQPAELGKASPVEAYVVVQNKNIGHSLLPEVRDLYEAWVAFTVKDAQGHEIYKSGYLKPDGMLDPGAHSFTNRPVDARGEFVDNHKVWTIHSVAYDNTIQAGRSTLVRYKFRVPPQTSGSLTITAAVEYRHLRQSYLNNVFGPNHPDYPIIEIASRTRTLKLGENTPEQPQANDNPDWMRWNNLGIGYLDELQYDDAMHAFERVTELRPDLKDGYINLAVNAIEWEKYGDARASLEKALTLRPKDARALYYLALVERRQRHSEAEIDEMKEVVQQYPQSRDARRELGISYYQQHRVEDAMAQFKALQAIDPDDLAAHYNLAILYRRMGMKQQASAEAAQYAMKRIDPGAPTYSLDYLRNHPEISNESVPWHIHQELMQAPQPEPRQKSTHESTPSAGTGAGQP